MSDISEDFLGNNLKYPEGDPSLTTSVAVWESGFVSPWHYHPFTGSATILQGELTVDFDTTSSIDDSDGDKNPSVRWYPDLDSDGYGDMFGSFEVCDTQYSWTVANNDDCDDSSATTYTGATEIRADGIDQDCDGSDIVWDSVSMGSYGACALDVNGDAVCWGGLNLEIEGPFVEIDYGSGHACGRYIDNTVECFGTTNSKAYAPYVEFSQISLGNAASCGIQLNDGAINCWGTGSIMSDIPIGVFSEIELGDDKGCAIRNDGSIDCWGNNANNGVLGGVPSGSNFEKISVGTKGACAVDDIGVVTCWGVSNASSGEPNSTLGPFIDVGIGYYGACALDVTGDVYCWGHGGYNATVTNSLFGNNLEMISFANVGQYLYAITYEYEDNVCGVNDVGNLICWGPGSLINGAP